MRCHQCGKKKGPAHKLLPHLTDPAYKKKIAKYMKDFGVKYEIVRKKY